MARESPKLLASDEDVHRREQEQADFRYFSRARGLSQIRSISG